MGAQDDHPPVSSGVVLVGDGTGDIHLYLTTAVGTDGGDRSIDVRLHWQHEDPLTVWIDVDARPDHPALPCGRWVILRDFLRYGMEERAGDGDVQVFPDPAAGLVHLYLARPTRPCRVSVPAVLLEDFLAHTERRIPFGEERSDELLEAFIEKLLH